VGSSPVEDDKSELAKKKGVELILPVDVLPVDKFAPDVNVQTYSSSEIPDGWMGLDIGPDAIMQFEAALKDAKTVLWNGPKGVFKFDAFSKDMHAANYEGVTPLIAVEARIERLRKEKELPAPFEEEAPAEIDATAIVTEEAAKPGHVPAPVEGEEKSIEEKASLLAERETRENRVFALDQDLEEAEKTSHSTTEKIHTLEEQVKSLTTESEELRKSQIPKEDFLSVKKNVKELSEDKAALLKEIEALTDEKDELQSGISKTGHELEEAQNHFIATEERVKSLN
jgi:archaellum component FlaC